MNREFDRKHADKKSTTTSKNDKTEEESWNMLGTEKSNTIIKTKDTTRGNKPGAGENRKTKKISR